MNWARLFAIASGAAFAVGLGALIAPGLFALGIEQYVVIGIGAIALLGAFQIVRLRRTGSIRYTETGNPERLPSVAAPGDELDRLLAGYEQPDSANRRRDQLRRVVIDALVRYQGLSEAEATAQVDDGTWTDDTVAASYLGTVSARSEPLASRIRTRFSGTAAGKRTLVRTANALAAVADLPQRSNEDASLFERLRQRFDGRPTGVDRAVAVADPEPRTRLTERWHGISGIALLAVGVGALAGAPAVILIGVVGIGYAAYARSTTPPEATLSLERTVDAENPDPGNTITVTLTVTNDGDRMLPDVRLVDGVPAALPVIDGSPRMGTALRPDTAATVTYTLEARRGRHDFGPAQVLVRNTAGSVEREQGVSTDETTTVTCRPQLEPVGEPVELRKQHTQRTGRVDTSTGGDGTEFFATREYRPGDPMSRIDWNRHARTGDLATLEFREERSATVVLVVDRDRRAAVGPEPHGDTAIERSVDAANRVFTTLLSDGNRVGIAALGDADCWLPPGAGEVHRSQARELLSTDHAFERGQEPPAALPYRWLSRLREQFPGDAQVVLFSPLCSATVAIVARQLDAYGHPVTVVSPDPMTRGTPAGTIATVVRRFRISDLRAASIPVVDWQWDEPLPVSVAQARRRRAR